MTDGMQRQRPHLLESVLLKPYYWLRPSQIFRRLRYSVSPPGDPEVVRLPWGLDIECSPNEMIGRSIIRTGMFEILTTEALVRLIDPGELVLDVGANIGYMTSVLASATGSGGRVVAYEPNPEVYLRLTRNVKRWSTLEMPKIELRETALSDQIGTAPLTIPEDESEWASIGERPGQRAEASAHTTLSVPTVTLDAEIEHSDVGVLKLDVEDHEPAVLSGGHRALEQGRIRDILLEDHASYPSDSTATLEAHGYSVFNLAMRRTGIALQDPATHENYTSWDAPMRLATRDPERARLRLSSPGWRSLRSPSRWCR